MVITGWDNNPVGAWLFPALTTVEVDYEELGRRAMHRLVALVRGEAPRNRTDWSQPFSGVGPRAIVIEASSACSVRVMGGVIEGWGKVKILVFNFPRVYVEAGRAGSGVALGARAHDYWACLNHSPQPGSCSREAGRPGTCRSGLRSGGQATAFACLRGGVQSQARASAAQSVTKHEAQGCPEGGG